MAQLQPLGDRIVVRRNKYSNFTEGGVFLPDPCLAKANDGVVLSVGPGRMESDGSVIPVDVRPGDTVFFDSQWAGSEIEHDGETYLFLRETDLVAKGV